ncbi:hypothetical protein [Pseudomonas boanensis]|uniref:hypothetical protein n=1 Tax=Metapseudomonas boanensis TaxID=2822138 RepID=UPI0035D43F8C
MAKDQQQRDQAAAEKRKRLGEEELRHRVRPGTKQQLADLMAWHGIDEQAEAIQLLIMNTHALGPERSAPALSVPRHEITLSENVAHELYNEGARLARHLDTAER